MPKHRGRDILSRLTMGLIQWPDATMPRRRAGASSIPKELGLAKKLCLLGIELTLGDDTLVLEVAELVQLIGNI